MLRTLLVGILAMTAAAACSSKGEAPAAQPGVAAGKVVELTGTVTATRGTQVRTLAAGGEISSDDVIDTAAESRVVILVAHNNARWDLGPNKHGKVGESLAWTAAKQDRPATAVIEESSTAGAHAEKSAATTGTTTAEATRERADGKPADRAAAAPAAQPAAIDDLQTKGGDPAPPVAEPTAPPPAPPGRAESSRRKTEASPGPRPMAPKLADEEKAAAPIEAPPKSSRENNTRSPEKTVAPKVAQQKSKRDSTTWSPENTIALGDSETSPSGSVLSGAGAGSGSAVGPVHQIQQEIRAQFAKGRMKMRACIESGVGGVQIDISVTQGVYAIHSADLAVTAEARACLEKLAKGMGPAPKHGKPVFMRFTLAKP